MVWFKESSKAILRVLSTSSHGLSGEEAKKRQETYGLNVLPETKTDPSWMIFLGQFKSPLIYVLLVAAFVIFFLGERTDAGIILFVLLFNAVVGAIQEGRAQRILLALKKFSETSALVLRDGKAIVLADKELVPGDIIILRAGDKVPADGRILESNSLKVNEAALTGESESVHKIAESIQADALQPADQKNIVFKGTAVVLGNARAVVVSTGMKTEIGKISQEIGLIESEIPLKKDIALLSRGIIIAVALINGLLLLGSLAMGKELKEVFLTLVSLSVSIIPEGLPIVMTLVLATGVWRMSKRNALVKKLHAVEALGQASILATDKTGTLTKNEMVVEQLWIGGYFYEVSGTGYDAQGEVHKKSITGKKQKIHPAQSPAMGLVAQIAALSADAQVTFLEEEQRWKVSGDPTEAALVVLAAKLGFIKGDIERTWHRVLDIPFDYKKKYHASIYERPEEAFISIAGAPEVILEHSKRIWHVQKNRPLTMDEKENIEKLIVDFSKQGLRVLALGFHKGKPNKKKIFNIASQSFVFAGLCAMRDNLRPEVKEAVALLRDAGLGVVMVTGDNKITAQAIAKEGGIYREHDSVITGQELETLDDRILQEKLSKVSVFARVTPEHKMRIIEAYKRQGYVIAMTGDGVNDAPSLVAADLGIAMGAIGTEVAKEAADIVLLDDNLMSIVAAVEEGRNIYRTIKKVILYLFSTSVGEVLTIAGALVLTLPFPINPAQILWLNLVTDGFLDVALAMEPKAKGLLRRSWKKSSLVDGYMFWRILVMAIPMMVGTLYLFSGYANGDITKAWTISLTTLAMFQWFNAWNCRNGHISVFARNPLSSPYLVGATVIVILLQIAAVYVPTMQSILHTTSLSLEEWLMIIPVAASIIVVEEIRKLVYRRRVA